MPIRLKRRFNFREPGAKPVSSIIDFSDGLNTRDPEQDAKVRTAYNVRFGLSSGFATRKGTRLIGQPIGTSTKILGLHSYVKKGNTAQLLATTGTDIYRYTESSTPVTVATTTNAQGTGYSKDRHAFFTTVTDTNTKPYLVIIYQSGTGIKLEWSDSTGGSSYATWTNTVLSIDASTSLFFSGVIDSSDNIHLVYNSDANTVKYIKLTYAAGPSWTAGSPITIAGSGASDSASAPSILRTSTGTLHACYRYYNGTDYDLLVKISIDGGITWGSYQSLGLSSTNSRTFGALITDGTKIVAVSQKADSTNTSYYYHLYSTTYSAGVFLESHTDGTDGAFTAVLSGDSIYYSVANVTSSSGLTSSTYSLTSSSRRRLYSVVNDGANDNDITYQNIINGSIDVNATRVTNDSNNNKYPTVPYLFSDAANFDPVFWIEGTASPYNIKVNSSVNWAALSASLTTNLNTESAYFPSTGAGGTDQIYFTNGTNTVKKWNGSALTSASASGYPTPTWIMHYENRLWMGGDASNRVYYTDLGSDNFTGTFPAGNTIDFPEDTLWGHVYRGRVGLIFTRKSVYRMENFDYTGSNVGPEKLRAIPDSFGTLSGRTVQQIGYWTYYQRPDGGIARTNGEYAEAVSDKIDPTIQNLSLSQLPNAAAGTLGDYYYLALTDSLSSKNDLMIVLDTKRCQAGPNGGGYSIDTGKNASVFVAHPDSNGQPQLYYGESTTTDGSVYQAEIGTSDNGTAIALDVRTGTLYYGNGFYRTALDDMLVVADATGNWNLTVSYATLSNLSSFTDKQISLDPGGAVWGQFVWGSFIWGGMSTIQKVLHINAQDRAFKFKFSNSGVDQPVSVQSASVQHRTLKDQI